MKKYVFLFLIIPFLLGAEKFLIDLQELGKIVYHFEDGLCKKVKRISKSGQVKYEHLYYYDGDKNLVAESLIGGLGRINYSGSNEEGYFLAKSPFGEQRWTFEDKALFEAADLEKVYDQAGRLIKKGNTEFFYEGANLVKVLSPELAVFYGYSNDGKKLYKKAVFEDREESEFYLYLGEHEIGSVSDQGVLKWLRIPGMSGHKDLERSIAIETENAVFGPIYDHRYNIVKLINIEDGSITETTPSPFGENLGALIECPWIFCSKRFDKDTNLVDFGYRNYDIEIKEWTSLDPLMQDTNPYRYCFNDPLQFLDPDGRAGFLVPILTYTGGALTFPLWGPEALAVGAGIFIGFVGYEFYQYVQENRKAGNDVPPFTWGELGDDPSKCPGKGFEWRGKSEPKDGKGSWFNPEKKESLHPDFNHPGGVKPHWDYKGSDEREARIYEDGTIEWK